MSPFKLPLQHCCLRSYRKDPQKRDILVFTLRKELQEKGMCLCTRRKRVLTRQMFVSRLLTSGSVWLLFADGRTECFNVIIWPPLPLLAPQGAKAITLACGTGLHAESRTELRLESRKSVIGSADNLRTFSDPKAFFFQCH